MEKKVKSDATAEEKKAPAARKPLGRKAKAPAKLKEVKAKPFDFVGRVESIAAKSGSSGETFEFGLRGRRGVRQTLKLETSDSFSLSIMAPIVTAAHATGAKIGVKVKEPGTAVPQVVAVESRPHLKRDS
jgi:hypothetical protein